MQAPANTVATARYTLMPLALRGGEGRHSMSQSSTAVTGVLNVTGDRAELALGFDTYIGYVHCPEEMRNGTWTTMQQCAPEGAKDVRTGSKVILTGSARTANGALVVSVAGEQDQRDRRIQPARLSLTCRDSYLGMTCSIAETNMFGLQLNAPHTLAFLTPGTKRFAITPTQVKDVGLVSGSLAIEGGTIAMTLAVDDGEPTTLPGTAAWQDHGISLSAQTSPTRNLGARCALDGDRLTCEVTGDRSILGKPEHIYSQMLLVPEREAVPAQAPRFAPASAPARA